jgi:hypothetical protein
MDLQTRKLNLITYLLQMKDEVFFDKLENYILKNEVELNTYINKLKSKGFKHIEVYCDNICIYEKGEFADYELTY